MNNNKNIIRDKISRKRTSLKKNKKYLFDEQIYKKSVELIETIPGNSVFIYESFEGEVSTKKIISKLRSKNYKISTPRVGGNREMIAVDISNEKLDFSKNPLSKKILDRRLEVVEIDIVLVPVIAFSKTGGRVGYGGGFYDEWFEKNPKPFRIGLAYSFQQFDDIIFENHDAQLNFLVSELEVFDFKNHCLYATT